MLRPFRRKTLLLFLFFLLCSASVLALPQRVHRTREEYVRRQDGAFNGPQTVQSVTNTNTPFGVITETCVTTLTPIVDQAGAPKVLAVKECTVVISGNNEGQGGTQTSDSLTTTSAQTTNTALPTTLTIISTTSSSTDLTTQSTQTPPPTLTTSSAGAGNTEISVIGTTSVPITSAPPAATTTAAQSATTAAPNDPSAIISTSIVTVGAGAGQADQSTSGGPSGTQAAENNASSSAAPFQLPGKQLQVLPIGLGVFAGISVIALIVVALVTYERTKYRKAFRQRKLAESGAAMGYGGTSRQT